MSVVIIGGGVAGSTAALRLAQAGHDVTVIEAGERLGGLVVSFEVAGTPLECFYHHVFPHESHIRGLIDELGLTPQLAWLKSSVGVLVDDRLWPFTSPLDLLRFGPLSFTHRLRAGVGALRLQGTKDWAALDGVPAYEWLASRTGSQAAEVIWEPLLEAKFGPAARQVPAAWMWGRFQQRTGARRAGGERLGYLRGGFRQVFDRLDARLRELGVDVRTSTRVADIEFDGDRAVAVRTDTERLPADAVVYTGAMPSITRLVPDELTDSRWRGQGLGVLCVVLELDRPISDIYWTNVCDPELPFGGLIEHTNLVPASDYAGTQVAYLSRYFTAEEPVASAEPRAEAQRWVELLAKSLPSFDPASVRAIHPFRTPYAAPLVSVGYRATIPPMRSHLPGLYVCTTAQIYPQDRGMSEGVRTGGEVADLIAGDLAGAR
jgi:protoporphyrinogen oxidase